MQPIISWIFLGKFLCRNFFNQVELTGRESSIWNSKRENIGQKGSNLVRCEQVDAHREHILFQLYFSTALRNVGRKSFSNRNFSWEWYSYQSTLLKILGQTVFNHVRIYTENTFYSTNILTISWANSGVGIFQPGNNPAPPVWYSRIFPEQTVYSLI